MEQPRKHPDREVTFLTQDEVKRLFAVIKRKRDRALFTLAYHHGLRASEVGLLQITDLDLKQGRISIHRVKDSSSGVYPLQPSDMKLIRAYLRERSDGTDSPTYLVGCHAHIWETCRVA